MPTGEGSVDRQLHELYEQAQTVRARAHVLAGQLRATRRETEGHWQLIQVAWARAERIRARWLTAHDDPDRLRYSAYARLQARLASMPVIEQAKGIIMARYGWTERQAFDALRRASQRSNVRLRDLASTIVASTAAAVSPSSAQASAAAVGPPADTAAPATSPGVAQSLAAHEHRRRVAR